VYDVCGCISAMQRIEEVDDMASTEKTFKRVNSLHIHQHIYIFVLNQMQYTKETNIQLNCYAICVYYTQGESKNNTVFTYVDRFL